MDPDKLIPAKNWYTSKTLWVSVIAVLIGVLQYIQGNIDAGSQVTALGVLMAALRLVTKQPILTGE